LTKRDKLRRKIRNNPKNVKFSELKTLLLNFGFVLIRSSGSHHLFRYSEETLSKSIVIPVHGSQVGIVYVETVTETLDQLFPIDEQVEGENDDE
jgi:predicted RNA binding protein YcfA (HicA-like mRNA interferase family)